FAISGDVRLHGRLRRQSAGAEVHRHDTIGFGRLGDTDRPGPDRAVWLAALDHGPPWLQAALDPADPAAHRAEHLRAGLVPGLLPADVAVARHRDRRLGCPATSRPLDPLGAVRRGLAPGLRGKPDDRPLRPVRNPAGLAVPAWPPLHAALL